MRTRILAIFSLLVLTGCPDAHQKVLRGTLSGLNTARDGFVTWDMSHQSDLVEKAVTLEDGQNKLREYRQSREKVVYAFEVAYKALAIAALDPSTVTVATVITAAKDVYDLIVLLKNGAPKPPSASAPTISPGTSPGTGGTP
jgi:hypothetical protein